MLSLLFMTIIVHYLMGAYIHTSVPTIRYESKYERHPILLLSYRIVYCLNVWRNKMDFKIEIEIELLPWKTIILRDIVDFEILICNICLFEIPMCDIGNYEIPI